MSATVRLMLVLMKEPYQFLMACWNTLHSLLSLPDLISKAKTINCLLTVWKKCFVYVLQKKEALPFISMGQTCGMWRHALESVGAAYFTAGNAFFERIRAFFQRQSKGQTCGMGRHTLESVGVAYLTAGNVFLKRSRACFFRGNASLVKVMPFSPTVKTFSLLLIRRHCLLCQRYWLFPQWQGLYQSLYPIVNACFAEGSSFYPAGKAFFNRTCHMQCLWIS